jgi:hypothetical protein
MGAVARVGIHNHFDIDRLRVLTLDGEEIHRCSLRPRRKRGTSTNSAA